VPTTNPNAKLNEEMLRHKLEEEPCKLDRFGDPVFRKELLRLLLARGRWSEAEALVTENNIPSESAGRPGWHHILFARALD
jgi:hypothetical protein